MFTFRTSPPLSYIPPNAEEMKQAAEKVGLKSFARDLVADLCNLAAGGMVNPPSHYRDTVRRKADETLPAPDKEGRWTGLKESRPGQKNSIGSSVFASDRHTAVEIKTAEAMRYHQNVCDFLQSVLVEKFPGNTPLEQAMSLLKLLSKQSGGQGGGESGEPLPIFEENSTPPEGVAKTLHDAVETAESLSEEELDMLDPEGNAHEVDSQKGDGERSGHQGVQALKVAEDLVAGSDKRAMLDISRHLDKLTKLQVRRQRLLEADPAGEETRTRPIRGLSELARVNKSAWATRQQSPTYFLYQAVSGQLPVRERVTRLEKKQAIFILVDGSGSMKGKKHWKATGVVMNRLKAVLSDDAEVFVSVFDTTLGNVSRASTPDEGRSLIKSFAKGNFRGGGTEIAACVKAAHKYLEDLIDKGELLYRPEVCVLTDEDSSVQGVKKSDLPGTTVHGFAMEVANPALVAFAKSTGGVGIDKF